MLHTMPAAKKFPDAMNGNASVIDWLLAGDASIRWQVMRDLLELPRSKWENERTRVASNGWGADLLARQERSGQWGGGIYGPKWISTTYTLLQLREMGLPPGNSRAIKGCGLIAKHMFGTKSSPKLFAASGCTCMMGMWLALPAYFGVDDVRLKDLVDHLLNEQMPDGGWNCRRSRDPKTHHSSFHTTLNVLDGVREAIDRKIGPTKALKQAEARAIELLLEHRLYKSDKTGKVIKEAFTKLTFPVRWHYDVLRGLDYLRTTPAIHDKRLNDAFELLESKRDHDGRWPMENEYSGEQFFRMESRGKPSRWNTLRAMRCLRARCQ